MQLKPIFANCTLAMGLAVWVNGWLVVKMIAQAMIKFSWCNGLTMIPGSLPVHINLLRVYMYMYLHVPAAACAGPSYVLIINLKGVLTVCMHDAAQPGGHMLCKIHLDMPIPIVIQE